jgi:hypothetical protein
MSAASEILGNKLGYTEIVLNDLDKKKGFYYYPNFERIDLSTLQSLINDAGSYSLAIFQNKDDIVVEQRREVAAPIDGLHSEHLANPIKLQPTADENPYKKITRKIYDALNVTEQSVYSTTDGGENYYINISYLNNPLNADKYNAITTQKLKDLFKFQKTTVSKYGTSYPSDGYYYTLQGGGGRSNATRSASERVSNGNNPENPRERLAAVRIIYSVLRTNDLSYYK